MTTTLEPMSPEKRGNMTRDEFNRSLAMQDAIREAVRQRAFPVLPARLTAESYPFCDTSKCPWWRGYCSRDPACDD